MKKFFLLFSLLGLLVVSCSKDDDLEEVIPPIPINYTASLSGTSVSEKIIVFTYEVSDPSLVFTCNYEVVGDDVARFELTNGQTIDVITSSKGEIQTKIGNTPISPRRTKGGINGLYIVPNQAECYTDDMLVIINLDPVPEV